MRRYPDVTASITYTFYAHVPYVHISETMEFTADRAVRVVRMGEIVVDHTRRGPPDKIDIKKGTVDAFTHFAWPEEDGSVFTRKINDFRNEDDGIANVEGQVPGALGVLERDVKWVAGINVERGYGLASLRRNQFAGNLLGGSVPHMAPCTYVANYGWGFTYWSRPFLYPMGLTKSGLDQNLAISAGTFFAIEEAVLIFSPDEKLSQVQRAHREFTEPLGLKFNGAGPWEAKYKGGKKKDKK